MVSYVFVGIFFSW